MQHSLTIFQFGILEVSDLLIANGFNIKGKEDILTDGGSVDRIKYGLEHLSDLKFNWFPVIRSLSHPNKIRKFSL